MKRLIKRIPLITKLRWLIKEKEYKLKEKEYKQKFATDLYGGFWGVFETFEQAQQASPPTKSIGYNNPDLAKEYQEMLENENWENSGRTIRSHDYPVLFWLQSIFIQSETNPTIFDFGGNVGIHFYTYSKYLKYPENLHWTVCDLPEITKAGRKVAEKRNINSLTFTNSFEEINHKSIFIASGSIQYEGNLSNKLDHSNKPNHILINRLPLYNGKQFVTLQNGGKVFYPQFVFNKTEFIESITSIGYELIDVWQDNVDSCIIPFHPKNSVPVYSGLYFKLRS
jgi:hypothetical protein